MSDFSKEAEEVLAEAALDEPRPEELEAARQRVYQALMVTPPPGPGIATPTSGVNGPVDGGASSAGGAASLKALLVGVVALGGAGALVAREATRDEPPPAAVSSPPPTPAFVAPEPSAAPPAPPSASSAGPPPSAIERALPAPKHGGVPRPSESAPAPAEEALLVAAAEAQLRAGQASAALALYDRYLREHPTGLLRQESVAGRILSLCALGRVEQGRAELQRFETRHPSSPALVRLRKACGIEP